MQFKNMTLEEIEALAFNALVASGASEENARSLAIATAATEADGVASHGLAYIPIYCEHIKCGKVIGDAKPVLHHPKPAFLHIDAQNGFAHPAIDLGFSKALKLAEENGIIAISIYNSYNCGVLGYHTYRLAKMGLLGLGFTNAPASIAPSGGSKPVVGTNPFSIATPNVDGEPEILIDQSASTIAKSEVMKHSREGKSIPVGWALDEFGQPTTDPNLGLKGSMAPSGGYKGVGVAILVEILAAALSGAHLGTEASPFSGPIGGPPSTGQFFLAIHPNTTGQVLADKVRTLSQSISSQEGTHIPGQGRAQKRLKARDTGVSVNLATVEKIDNIIKGE